MALALQSSPFALILSTIVARVAYCLNINSAFVFPVDNDDYKVTIAEPIFSFLRVYGPVPCDASSGSPLVDGGAGRLGRNISRRIRCYLYIRSGLDLYGQDTIALIGDTPSQTVLTPPTLPPLFTAEEIVLNGLDDWSVIINNVNLAIGPLHLLTDAGPAIRRPENEEGLSRSNLDFEIVYTSSIINSESAPTTLPRPTSVGNT